MGLLTGHVGIAVALALAAVVLRQLYMLQRVCCGCAAIAPTGPDAGGVWGDVIGLIVRLHRRKQYHKQRMRQLLRELRAPPRQFPTAS